MRPRPWILTGALLTALAASAPSAAQDRSVDEGRAAYSLSRELMSPYCPGRTLADCPSPNAAALREEIRGRLAEGATPDEVRSDLEARYGDRVRAVPRGALVWIIPAAVLLAGLIGLGVALRRLSAPAEDASVAPELEREIERELRERGL